MTQHNSFYSFVSIAFKLRASLWLVMMNSVRIIYCLNQNKPPALIFWESYAALIWREGISSTLVLKADRSVFAIDGLFSSPCCSRKCCFSWRSRWQWSGFCWSCGWIIRHAMVATAVCSSISSQVIFSFFWPKKKKCMHVI